MPRSIKSPSGGSTYVTTITADQGGTGVTTAPEALLALNAIPENKLGQPLGPVQLNANGGFDPAILAGLSLSESGIDGPSSISQNATEEYFITTYDSYQTYEVVGIQGTAVRDRNVIRYTAGGTPGQGGFTINGRKIVVEITDTAPVVTVVPPTLTAPSAGTQGVNTDAATVTASAFVILNGTETHVSSDWELATSSSFASLVSSSYSDAVNLTSWTLSQLQPGTNYYVRTRQRGSSGTVSDWSGTISFLTSDNLPNHEAQTLAPQDPVAGDHFGSGVAISGDGMTALVGAYNKTGPGGAQQGAAYVFTRSGDTWTQQAKLMDVNGAASDWFGWSVALSEDGNTALVGAPEVTTSALYAGVVFVFVRSGSTWTQQARLEAQYPSNSGNFGRVVSLSADGNVAAIAGSQTSYGHIFRRTGTTWVADYVFQTPSTSITSCAISADGNTALFGEPTATFNGVTGAGVVVTFTYSGGTWQSGAPLYPDNAADYGRFGTAVALSGDGNIAVVTESYVFNNTGYNRAFVFTRSGSTWTQQAKMISSDFNYGKDTYGDSVAISKDGSTIVVGSSSKTINLQPTGGACYVYTKTNGVWTEKAVLKAANQDTGAYFGWSLALTRNGAQLLVGAHAQDLSAYQTGAAYLFD